MGAKNANMKYSILKIYQKSLEVLFLKNNATNLIY